MPAQQSATVTRLRDHRGLGSEVLNTSLQRAARRVAPLWPLDQFVAVNPFLGLSEEAFPTAARRVELACGGRLLMDRAFYRRAIDEGRIRDSDLAAVIVNAGKGLAVSAAELKSHAAVPQRAAAQTLHTCADIVSELDERDWSALVTERVTHWASGYFDAGQASWPSPFRDMRPWQAWLAESAIDCSDSALGLRRSQGLLATFPRDPVEFCSLALQRLAVPLPLLDLYLHRLLMDISGWAAYARFRGWQDELAGGEPRWVIDLLAVRLAWDLILFNEWEDRGAALRWRRLLADPETLAAARLEPAEQDERDLLLHQAYENAWQRQMIDAIRTPTGAAQPERPAAQIVFCIDVRSEVIRRALEGVNGGIETLGFAGFFGLPFEFIPLASDSGSAHCPVLLKPAMAIRESAVDKPEVLNNRLTRRVQLRQNLARGWRAFKNSAVSCFVFVESYGLSFAVKLVAHTLGLSRPAERPEHRGLPPRLSRALGPQLGLADDEEQGIGLERQIEFAESMLRGMSLTSDFARVVMLAGHGSSTTNNAHATGLDCGACGGRTGEASARAGAMILNNPAVRAGLVERGITVPDDTVFVAALHDTTTDEFEVFDQERLPASHREELTKLEQDLEKAGELARGERSLTLPSAAWRDGLPGARRRSLDWSEVRPEWGLAGCAGFVAAPRNLTRKLNLDGRCFLHSYEYRDDRDFAVLELIMTAPMVVASWINLQYYGSTVDNKAFGSGDKTLQNVIGASVGVLEGSGGDLRTGLPLQSVHDGSNVAHEPMRLSVFLAAPIAAINRVLETHQHVRDLVDNEWIHLFAIYDDGAVVARYSGDSQWAPILPSDFGEAATATGE